jgi:hypothetical protein
MQGYNPTRALGQWKSVCSRRYHQGSRHWKDSLIPPLARAICREKGWDGFQIGPPQGLCCRVGIAFVKGRRQVFWLQVCNPDLETGTLQVTDYEQDNGEFAPHTIGHLNGMNHPNIVIDPEWDADKVLSYGCEIDEPLDYGRVLK